MGEPFRGNIFVHPMSFDATGKLIDSDLVVLQTTIQEAIEQQFGPDTADHGEKHCVLGSVSYIEDGKVFTQTVYQRRTRPGGSDKPGGGGPVPPLLR